MNFLNLFFIGIDFGLSVNDFFSEISLVTNNCSVISLAKVRLSSNRDRKRLALYSRFSLKNLPAVIVIQSGGLYFNYLRKERNEKIIIFIYFY